MSQHVTVEVRGISQTVTICRPEKRNAIDAATAQQLVAAFELFERDEALAVAILTGVEGCFCAGADLKAVSSRQGNVLKADGYAPLGVSRLLSPSP